MNLAAKLPLTKLTRIPGLAADAPTDMGIQLLQLLITKNTWQVCQVVGSAISNSMFSYFATAALASFAMRANVMKIFRLSDCIVILLL